MKYPMTNLENIREYLKTKNEELLSSLNETFPERNFVAADLEDKEKLAVEVHELYLRGLVRKGKLSPEEANKIRKEQKLSALEFEPEKPVEVLSGSVQEIDIDKISMNEQIRKKAHREGLEQLAESISHFGLMHPICVKKTESGYDLVYGGRRLAACKLAGRTKISATVAETEFDVYAAQVVENYHREGLSPYDEVRAIRKGLEEGRKQTEMAKLFNMKESNFSLLAKAARNIPEDILEKLEEVAPDIARKSLEEIALLDEHSMRELVADFSDKVTRAEVSEKVKEKGSKKKKKKEEPEIEPEDIADDDLEPETITESQLRLLFTEVQNTLNLWGGKPVKQELQDLITEVIDQMMEIINQ